MEPGTTKSTLQLTGSLCSRTFGRTNQERNYEVINCLFHAANKNSSHHLNEAIFSEFNLHPGKRRSPLKGFFVDGIYTRNVYNIFLPTFP
jgi:hypothetical protein